jgi:Tol biopolymer transport system component
LKVESRRSAAILAMPHPPTAGRDEGPRSLVLSELDRILASELFSRSDRLSTFLRFIVEETLEGRGESLKEQVIAMEVYGRRADFSTAADPIVRVDARRLRDKLREYYASAPRGAVTIAVRKGSYTPVFETGDVDEAVRPGGRPSMPRRVVIAAVAVAMVGTAAWMASHPRRDDVSPHRLLTVTAFPGVEDDPALSPDGNFVAFAWPGPTGDTSDIWVKPVEGDTLRRLTETPSAIEKWAQWSPDGRHLVFTRMGHGTRVHTISALGGPEQQVADGSMATWTPDGRAMVMVTASADRILSVVHQTLDTGARRVLTTAPAGFSDWHPRVSPDGTTVAFGRSGAGRSAIFVVAVAGGEARVVGDWASGVIGGLTWTPDGREIIYSRPGTSGRRLVRTTVDAAQPTEVGNVPFGATGPTVPAIGGRLPYRLGFVAGQVDVGLRLVDLAPPPGGGPLSDTAFADATRLDWPGRFSPDGADIAFSSDRGGSPQVWIAGRDGAHLRSATHLEDATVNVGSWSPDGQWVSFDATVAGRTDLYVVRRDGGSLRRLTNTPAIDADPEWSRDGRWIFYRSDESGVSTIWKMPSGGGPGVQVTTEGGYEPRQAPDGRSLYFIDLPRQFNRVVAGTIKQVSVDGGAVSVVHGGVSPGTWDVTDTGIVFVVVRNVATTAAPDALAMYDFADRRVRVLGTLGFPVVSAFTTRYLIASRDGRWAAVGRMDKFDRDIMVVEGFR